MIPWLARISYRFKNWFRTKPRPGEPLRFLRGSEEELRRVTTWMCYSAPSLFKLEPVTVVYKARNGAGRYGIIFSGDFFTCLTAGERKYLCKFSQLISKYNQFTGTEWRHVRNPEYPYLNTLFGYSEWDNVFCIEVRKPSAHEQAEALLSLSEWLHGKVSEQEKRELLQLPDDTEA